MKQKRIQLAVIVFCLLAILTGTMIFLQVKTQVKDLFKMNKALQEDGYYMADFEFKLLGFEYYLDKGHPVKAMRMLSDYHRKLKNRDNLLKIPDFKNSQEEIDFYLNLQNPETGAFIDDSAPFCVYWEVSNNILNHLEALTQAAEIPLKLKYPLSFLDEINTPEKLTAHLDDISYVGWLASRFPQTTFHFARNLLGQAMPGSILERTGLYRFSPEWKPAMLKWMYSFQDHATGMWGPKNKRTNKLLKLDLNNTASILKSYRDCDGNDIHRQFPLKYREKLFKSAIQQLSQPFPNDDDLDEIHEWNLQQAKGIAMLLRHLWKDASDKNKRETKQIIARHIDICFDKYYVKKDGAFSYYPNAAHASCDGISNLIFKHIGAFSYERQKKLWGDPSLNATDLGQVVITELNPSDLDSLVNIPDVNSIRIYIDEPDFKTLTLGVWAVFYPKATPVLDLMELVPRIVHWTQTSSLSTGNWSSMEKIKRTYSALNIEKTLILKSNYPLKEIDKKLKECAALYFVGFDKLQIPRCKIKFITRKVTAINQPKFENK